MQRDAIADGRGRDPRGQIAVEGQRTAARVAAVLAAAAVLRTLVRPVRLLLAAAQTYTE